MVGRLQPLVDNQRIVRTDGTPTEYFIRWAQQRQIDIGQAVSEARALEIVEQFLADNPLIAGSGIALTPSGNIADGVTIAAQVQAILDQITTTQGSILYRGASDWEALAPGTSGQVLQTNGAAANPSWVTPSGGGGGAPLIAFTDAAPGSNSGNIATPLIVVKPCIAVSADPVTGLILPCSSTVAGRTAAPCIYDGGLFSAPTTATGTALVASGAGVALVNNSMVSCPFSTPFTPTVGRLYYAGFSIYGTAGNINLWATGAGQRQFSAAGTFNPPPANLPTMTNSASANAGWWSY